MSEFDPASFRAMTIDGYDVADGVFTRALHVARQRICR